MKSEPAPEPTSAWEKLAAARRHVLTGLPPGDESAPFGFAPRIAARAMAFRRDERLMWWTRWSMRGAACAGLVAATVVLRLPPADGGAPLLSAPALEIPGFSAL